MMQMEMKHPLKSDGGVVHPGVSCVSPYRISRPRQTKTDLDPLIQEPTTLALLEALISEVGVTLRPGIHMFDSRGSYRTTPPSQSHFILKRTRRYH